MKTRAIAVAILKFKDKVLLLRRTKDRTFSPNKWEFVSGGIKEGESAEYTALREIKEETGLDAKIIKSGKAFEAKNNDGRWMLWLIWKRI